MGGFLKEFLTYDLLRTMFIELFKAGVTLLFAYISFRFFQNYREKKENNKTYIKLLKLKDNIKRNIEKINEIINLYIEGEKLHSELKINGSLEKYYYDIAKKIKDIINLYLIDESYTDFYNELVETSSFNRYPIEYIRDVSNEIEYLRQVSSTEGEIESLEIDLDSLQQKDIMKDLEELYTIIVEADKDKKLKHISDDLEKFNEKDITTREKELNKLCKEILQKDKKIIELLDKYDRYDWLVGKILENRDKEEVTLILTKIDDKDEVLAAYDAEFYFEIETFIDRYNNSKISVDNRLLLDRTNQELTEFKSKLDVKIKEIKKKVDSTKLLFGK